MEEYILPEGLTRNAKEVLVVLAKKQAERLLHNFIGTEHILLGILDLGRGSAWTLLTEKLELKPEEIRTKIEDLVGMGPTQEVKGLIPFTPRAKKVVVLARRKASELRDEEIGTEHLLIGLLEEGDGVASRVLKQCGVEFLDVCQKLGEMRNPKPAPETGATEAVDQRTLDNTARTLIALLNVCIMSVRARKAITEATIVLTRELTDLLKKTGGRGVVTDWEKLMECLSINIETTNQVEFLIAAAHLLGKAFMETILDKFNRAQPGSPAEINWGTVLQIITGEQVAKPRDYLALWKKED